MFTNDFSRLQVVKVMTNKHQSLQMLQDFKRNVAYVNHITVNALRSDPGGKFTEAFFREYRERNDTTQEVTARYSPHQNGTAERL